MAVKVLRNTGPGEELLVTYGSSNIFAAVSGV